MRNRVLTLRACSCSYCGRFIPDLLLRVGSIPHLSGMSISSYKIHPIFHTIGPDTGPGFGVGSDGIWRRGELEYQASINAVVSINGSFEIQPKFVFAFPAFSFVELPNQDKSETNDNDQQSADEIVLMANAANIEAKASLTFQGSWIDAKGQ